MNNNKTALNILKTMIREGSIYGLDNVSLSTIAKKLNIAKSSIFSHYKNKEKIIDEMYIYGQKLSSKNRVTFSFDGDSYDVLIKVVDHWHSIYSNKTLFDFYRIVEMQKFIDNRAKEISIAIDAMIISQTRIVLEVLNETNRLNIEELDLAIESFASTFIKYLKNELFLENGDLIWEEERYVARFVKLYKIS
ncbi:MAG: TetR/AcrR family transcriptional regulator [Sphaerochaetaceae bacterium]|nr:TetR/AcrR family transcriptional regulator [Sphaerochaetaceae bacterium]MDC7237984.1 TetR/AcrR family transcriptional regulator [Sphaerochaetaceae bacterium]MDC7244201.1 TetR/AcrR family transcriptional regulator [Sphaerochaetaceae bacterium]